MLKKSILSLSLIGLISAVNASGLDCSQVTQIPSTECEILVTFYNKTNGKYWLNKSGWLETNTPCSWYGVTCSGEHVSKLNLSVNSLTGSIPPKLGNLSNLEYLFLGHNALTGSIPPELGNLSNLTSLVLGSNSLTGSIPPELCNLSNLTLLHLRDNSLTGSIPPELGNLSNLRQLNLDLNSLTGSIPLELSNLSNLMFLHLDYNSLTGSIPPELSNLSYLRIIILRSNQLTGSIPPELGNLSQLGWLSLHSNSLTGSIPPELGNLSESLWGLELNNNQLCGEIPAELKNLSEIFFTEEGEDSLRLDNNHLTASDPELIAWMNIYNSSWDETQTPCLPKLQFSSVTYKAVENVKQAIVTVVRVGENSDGAVSIEYATSDDIATAPDDYIETSGTLNWADGDNLGKIFTVDIINDRTLENDETFIVSLSNPTGDFELGELNTATVEIERNDFACKKVTEIPKRECKALIAFYDSTNGENWTDNTGWKGTNKPCDWYGVSCQDGRVTELALGNNGLTGLISPKFFILKKLERLLLNNNKLGRHISDSFMNLNELTEFNLNDNCLSAFRTSTEVRERLDELNPGWDENQTACSV